MNVMIIATKNCTYRESLEKALKRLRIMYRTYFVEEHAGLVEKFAIQHSLNLVVNDEIVFRKHPTEAELHSYFDTKW